MCGHGLHCFIGDHFGIMRSFEFALLVGVNVRDRALMGETVKTVLERYGVKLDSS